MSSDAQPGPLRETTGAVFDILAIIESAKTRGGIEALERFVARSLPQATRAEVGDAAEVALEVIESVPVFMLRARQEADERGLADVVGPLLDRAERYYLKPIDLIPEMTQGLAGLLDDSYLVIRVLQNLDRGEVPFLDWDLDDPVRFLRRLMGQSVAERLDQIAMEAMLDASANAAEAWDRSAHDA